MLRTTTFRGWRSVVGAIVLAVSGLVLGPLVLLPVLAAGVALQGGSGSYSSRFNAAMSLDAVSPASLLYLNLSLASLALAAVLLVRWLHGLRPGWVFSVLPGVRWRFFGVCFGLGLVAVMAQLVVGSFLPADGNELSGSLAPVTATTVALALVVLVTTPLQALGEELAFRGYLVQAVGSFFGSARVASVVAVVVTATLFALAHGAQNPPLFFDRFAFGLMAGYVVVRTGGLEAGIALHVLNNLFAFGFAIAFGQLDSTLNISEVSWYNLPLTITQNGVYLVLVLLTARRMGLTARSAPRLVSPEVAV